MKRPPLQPNKCTKMEFIGITREDWSKYMRWLQISTKYNKLQAWNKYLGIPSIFLEASKYIDGRSHRAIKQVKVRVTIEEIT